MKLGRYNRNIVTGIVKVFHDGDLSPSWKKLGILFTGLVVVLNFLILGYQAYRNKRLDEMYIYEHRPWLNAEYKMADNGNLFTNA